MTLEVKYMGPCGPKNEFWQGRVIEPSGFEPLQFCCIQLARFRGTCYHYHYYNYHHFAKCSGKVFYYKTVYALQVSVSVGDLFVVVFCFCFCSCMPILFLDQDTTSRRSKLFLYSSYPCFFTVVIRVFLHVPPIINDCENLHADRTAN